MTLLEVLTFVGAELVLPVHHASINGGRSNPQAQSRERTRHRCICFFALGLFASFQMLKNRFYVKLFLVLAERRESTCDTALKLPQRCVVLQDDFYVHLA